MRNWTKVFGFTFHNGIRQKGFAGVTIGVAVVVFLVLCCVNVIMAASSDEDEATVWDDTLQTVYIINETQYQDMDYASLADIAGDIVIEEVSTISDMESDALAVTVCVNDDQKLEIAIEAGENSDVSDDSKQLIGETIGSLFQMRMAVEAGATEEQAQLLSYSVETQTQSTEEEGKSLGQLLMEVLAPMLISFVLYFLLITYGQSIGKIIIAEKASKLMELILTSLQPYAVLIGKITAMIAVAVLQFVTWIVGGVCGFMLGDWIAKEINPDYSNSLVEIMKLIRDSSVGNAFSVESIVFAVIILLLGFAFYCIFMGQVTAFVGKAEELSNLTGIYVIPVLISFMLSYMGPLMGFSDGLLTVLRYIPFTAAYLLPSDVLLGNVTLLETVLPCIILVVVSGVLLYTSGKVYKKKIFS